jgi:hypothetical protein
VASGYYAPDLIQFIAPSIDQALPGRWIYDMQHFGFDWSRPARFVALSGSPQWTGSGIETAVTIPITALVLGVAASVWATTREERLTARGWLLLGLVFVVLALGPTLRAAGATAFTARQVHLPLPQAWLSQLPGFSAMRTPGRFMLMGSVGFALAAGMGLMAIARRADTRRGWVIVAIAVLALMECWPAPWPQHALPPIPRFYEQMAHDGESYGVLDLPAGWLGQNNFSSAYHYFQMTHRKPIAWAYLSRSYTHYPLHGLDALWDARITDYAATRDRVARLGYRYVVWHKHADELYSSPRDGTDDALTTLSEPPVLAGSHPFIREAFRGERPVYDDDLVTVYRIR